MASTSLPSSPALTRSRAARDVARRVGPLVLFVSLDGPGGERWSAVGGGDTLDGALAFALASAPAGTRWRVAGSNDLYGD